MDKMKEHRLDNTEKSADGHRRKKVSNILSKSVRDAIYLERVPKKEEND